MNRSLVIEMLESRQLLSTTVHVPATSDPWLLAGNKGPFPGTAPVLVSLPAGTNQVLTFSSVTGTVTPEKGKSAGGGPDGSNTGNLKLNLTSVGGISGIIDDNPDSCFAFIGVFTTNTIPTANPPARQNYTDITGNSSFSPALDQTFFIGDGKTGTGTGATQEFYVPSGATKLYLGFPDGNSFQGNPSYYSDNGGSVTATLNVGPLPSETVSGSVLGDVNGKAGPGLPNWRVYVDANHDGRYDPGDTYVVTNSSGQFSFSLKPGTYTLGVEIDNGYAIASPKTFDYTVDVTTSPISDLTFIVKLIPPGL